MQPLTDLFTRAALDPLVRAALLAAGVLLVAALAGGLARRDALALRRPAPWLAVAVALLASLVLVEAGERLLSAVSGSDPIELASRGWERIPLYLLALAYGPSVGLLAALATAFVQAGPWAFGAAEATLVLETAVVGWLGLGPSPRRTRWAGPLAIVGGWLLATATLGLAAWAADGRPIALEPFARSHRSGVVAVGLAALAAAGIPPGWWRRRVPGAADRIRMERDDERVRWLRPLARPTPRRDRRGGTSRPAPRTIVPPPLRRPPRAPCRLGAAPIPEPLERPAAAAQGDDAAAPRDRGRSGGVSGR